MGSSGTSHCWISCPNTSGRNDEGTFKDKLDAAYPRADLDLLSMGMTQDFEVAVEEGANIVRIGTAIFSG